MELLKEWTELGQALGYEGTDLQSFVRDQQISERDERKARRDAEKAQLENEKANREHELEIKHLMDI